jgi:integrase
VSILQTNPTIGNPDSAIAAVEAALIAAGCDAAMRARIVEVLATTTAAPDVSFEEFEHDLYEQYAPQLRSKRTLQGIRYAAGVLKSVGVTKAADLGDVRLIGRIVSTRDPKLSPQTVRGILRHCSAIMTHAKSFGYIRQNPFVDRPIRTWVRGSAPRRKRHCSKEEISRVLAHMRQRALESTGWKNWKARREYACTACHIYTGARHGEIMWLQTIDVNLSERVIAIVSREAHRTKTAASEDVIPIAPPLVSILTEWMEHRMSAPPGFTIIDPDCPYMWPTSHRHGRAPWLSGSAESRPAARMKALALEVGVVGFGPQVLRRSCATLLPFMGVPQSIVSRILRHSEKVEKQFYVETEIAGLRDAVKNVEF